MKRGSSRAERQIGGGVKLQKRTSLDKLKIPSEIEYLFPNKVRLYQQMRELEENINSHMKQKLLAAKEDLLQNNSKVKRNLRLMVELNHSLPSAKQLAASEWKLRIEGRLVDNALSEEDLLAKGDRQQFLQFFERVRVEFPGCEDIYPSVEWVKAKSSAGSAFDCLEITRSINKEQKKKLANGIVKVKV
jgi:hypothetical protein